jgi:hypothetical protein
MSNNNAVVNIAAAAAAPQPKKLTEKVASLVSEREKVRGELSARLGKGARVANAAKFASLPREQQNLNAFAAQILARNAAAKEAKAKAKAQQLPTIAEAPIAAAKKKTSRAPAAAKASRKTVKNKKPANNSVEKEAKKLVKEMEKVEAKLRPVGLDAATVCDFQRRIESAGVDGKQVLKLCKSFLSD